MTPLPRSRRELERLFLQLGGTVEWRRRANEVKYRHPLCPMIGVTEGTKHDNASTQFQRLVRAVQRAKGLI